MNRSNIQTVLRNIIDSGMMAGPSASYSSTPESLPQKKPSTADPERSPLYVSLYLRKQPKKMDLSHSTLNIEEVPLDKYTSSTIGYGSLGELRPASTSLDGLNENSSQFPVVTFIFIEDRRFKRCYFIIKKLCW